MDSGANNSDSQCKMYDSSQACVFLYGYGLVNANNVKIKKRYRKMWSCEQFLVAMAVKTGISQLQGT